VVFDVDGVLVDTDASYVEAVVRTARWLLGERAKGIDRDLVKLFKRLGDWNNDWDLSYGLYCWRIGSPELPAETAARLPLGELRGRAGPEAVVGYDEVRGIFEEHYNGTARAVERFGAEPRVHVQHGLAEVETIQLADGLIAELRELGITKFGVVTGRTLDDWEQVRTRIPLPPETVVATDEDGRKPDPTALRIVVDRLGAADFISVGDTLNDLRMVQSLGRGHAVMLCSAEEEPSYRAAGCRLFVRRLADLPELVRSLR
jgi:HAD superfamily hydrolase (TIGR01548 family)